MGQIAEDMSDGTQCSWCGVLFQETHGYPVVCQSCYKDWLSGGKQNGKRRKAKHLLDAYGLQVASHKEF